MTLHFDTTWKHFKHTNLVKCCQ